MTNAAIHLHPNAHEASGPHLTGRLAAGESFLRGFLRHADVERFHFLASPAHQERLNALVTRDGPTRRPVCWIPANERARLRQVGVLQTPGPNLANEAWGRRIHGQGAYSLCGVTHTISTARVVDMISDLMVGPVEDFDAIICTSAAVRASVETQLDGVRAWFEAEYGGRRRRGSPQLATIPLGVDAEAFAPQPGRREAWRARLDIAEDAIVALYVGRFSRREKMNPALMAIALERAAKTSGAPLCWLNAGWAETPEEAQAWAAVRALCPSVAYRTIDGRLPEARTSIWSAADFFLSFSDNIQETFGLTPVEAMAAGLPCVVTDWDGYRDTVRHGEDGFRVPTVAPPPGNGVDIAYWAARGWMHYVDYVGATAQFTAIDYAEATAAISALAANRDLRLRLGRQAQVRARAVFDWSVVIPQYQALWGELAARRAAAKPEAAALDNPFRPDPFRIYGAYPSRTISSNWRVALAAGLDPAAGIALLDSDVAAYSPFNRPTPEECRLLLDWLAGRPEATVGEAAGLFPPARHPSIARGLLWIARYGLITLSPPDGA